MASAARTGRRLQTWMRGLAAASALACPAMAAAEEIDCPLRDQPYSIDTPLLDVLLKPDAKALVNEEAPSWLGKLPSFFLGTKPPTFSAIVTLRTVASQGHTSPLPAETLARVDARLRALPVTDQDRRARCARYDAAPVAIEAPPGKIRILVFQKVNGFSHGPAVPAAEAALRSMAARLGWGVAATDKGGAVTSANLRQFDVVVWNNVSGDVLTLSQRSALRDYVEAGGGFVALHGSGGDSNNFWDWYVHDLIGARFLGHGMNPQFQTARVVVDDRQHPIARGLPPEWSMEDEWYSFRSNPRQGGARVVARLDETSFKPAKGLEMGDHPIAWSRCVGKGRSFYSALGHRPAAYAEPRHLRMLEQAVMWAAGSGKARCVPDAER